MSGEFNERNDVSIIETNCVDAGENLGVGWGKVLINALKEWRNTLEKTLVNLRVEKTFVHLIQGLRRRL